MNARWWSQPVAAEGSIASQGIRRQLGKPNLDPLTVLVRETAQNSCDAAIGDRDVEFTLSLSRLSGELLDRWMRFLLPEPAESGLDVKAALTRNPTVLTISDRGSTGLGGPLRSDEVPRPNERPDFVNFVRNVGERKTAKLTGGSYGFGKGILYTLSHCHVVVADSVCGFRGSRQRRLIGAALGDSYRHQGRLYTGRHWLGNVIDDIPEPLLDDEAATTAAQLGLPGFDEGTTGTSVSVVAIDLDSNDDGSRDLGEAAQFLVSTMLWHLWPRMLSDRKNRLICRVSLDGTLVDIPDPEELPILAPFCAAYRDVTEGHDFEAPVRKSRPTDVGRFALKRGMAPAWDDETLAAAAPFDGRAHHCALMRQADLVVTYKPGEPMSNELLQYGGVFRASSQADPQFAEAEPPTHDDWVSKGLTGTSRGVVQLALRFISEKLNAASGQTAQRSGGSTEPLGHFAARLAEVIATSEGDSATATEASSTPHHSGRRSRTLRFIERPSLVLEEGQPIVRAVIELPHGLEGKAVRLVPAVVTDDGVERARDDDAIRQVIGWTGEETNRTIAGPTLSIDNDTERRWTVRVHPVPDTVTRVTFAINEGAT
jgi:hypothetical protein